MMRINEMVKYVVARTNENGCKKCCPVFEDCMKEKNLLPCQLLIKEYFENQIKGE